MEAKGYLFDIRRYTIHDGPGIRTTVFFKGCPLSCAWCHNPEGLELKSELVHYQNRCLRCFECMKMCEPEALSVVNDKLSINYTACTVCLKCLQVCNSQALELIGKEMSVHEVMAEVQKDMIFYEQSGGGVTFSGGEPLMQPAFLLALLRECKKKHIHTALDTCGYAPFATIEKLMDYIDLFLYDIKIIDNTKHKDYISKDNKLILENLERLAKLKKNIMVRIPIIPGYNDSIEALKQTAQFIISLGAIKNINLLPYHKAADEKYSRLHKSNLMKKINPPSHEKMESMKKLLEEYGFKVKIGG